EELGDRLYARLVIERHEEAGKLNQNPGVQLPVRHRHARGRALPGEPDDVLRADIGREDGSADCHEASIAAGKEVIDGVLLLATVPPGEEADEHEVAKNNGPVESGHRWALHMLAPI